MNVWDVVFVCVVVVFFEMKVIVIVGYGVVVFFGFEDGMMLCEIMIDMVGCIVVVVFVFVIVDLDDGYGDVGEIMWFVIGVGVVGVNVEDWFKLFVEFVVVVEVIVKVVEVEGVLFVLNVRMDVFVCVGYCLVEESIVDVI